MRTNNSTHLIFFLQLFYSISSIAQNTNIDYFNKPPTGNVAKIFAPGIISLPDRNECSISFSQNNTECFFTVAESGWATAFIYHSKKDSSGWSEPIPAPFSGKSDLAPLFAPCGNYIVLSSWRTGNGDIYICNKTNSNWNRKEEITSPINSPFDEWEATVTSNRTIYFSSKRSGLEKLYKSEITNSKYVSISELPKSVNLNGYQVNTPFISPDESYLLYSINKNGNNDIYISYKKDQGYTGAKNIGSDVNTIANEYYPFVSADNRHLFFTREENNKSDIYWVNIEHLIDSLRYTNTSPYVINPIPDTIATLDSYFHYTLPDSIFFDDDSNETLMLLASSNTIDNWPEKLYFNPHTRTLSGLLKVAGSYEIKITATDGTGAKVSDDFKLTVRKTPDRIK